MKTGVKIIAGMILLFSFSSCANGKNAKEEAPVPFEQAYYTTWTGGVKDAGSGFNLFIPTGSFSDSEIKLDSVYFRGRSAELVTKPEMPDLYIAYFRTSEKKDPDFVMSSDPREEYGNKPPAVIEKIPFELKEGEAMVSFIKNGKKNYYKISGIEKRDSDGTLLKKPENIQH